MVVGVGGERSRRNTLNFTNWMRRGSRDRDLLAIDVRWNYTKAFEAKVRRWRNSIESLLV